MIAIHRRLVLTAFIVTVSCGCAENVDTFRQRIAADSSEIMPLLAGMPAPEFTVRGADGEGYTFVAGPRNKPVVLTFYRGGWCPYCNRYLAKMRSAEKALLDLGYELLFISADRPEKLRPFLEETKSKYTLLSDNDLVAARAFGLAFRVTDDYFNKLLQHDIDLEDASGRNHHALPVPAAFVIGTDGIIDFQYLNPDYKIRVDPDVLITAARVALTDDTT
ncbi:MAG: AhpC/TSA family protein [Gammaproteobacteria bacterium]|nr:AhpC/TSA family protein [Gammaproteobacteria bacterium]MDH3767846.1 AhpC/TSA family protein [Gammaproteobacteria bacterium]